MSSGLYADGRHYDALLGDQDADIAWYLSQAKGVHGGILELACGTGRITVPLAASGADIMGLDLSGAMLESARAKAAAAGVMIDFRQGDMSAFDLGRSFGMIFLPYNSMQHLHKRPQLDGLFSCVKRHLAPGGRFLLDVHQPNLALLMRHPGEIYPVEGLGELGDGRVVTGEEVHYNDATQVYRIRWHYSPDPDGNVRQDELQLRMFFPEELDELLHYNGFRILGKYGDFSGKAFEAGDGKQVLVCELKGE